VPLVEKYTMSIRWKILVNLLGNAFKFTS